VKKPTGNMLIIKNAQGEVIAAKIETADDRLTTYITPVSSEHTIHNLVDVPLEICDLTHPQEFGKALTAHLQSPLAKVTLTTADEVRTALARSAAATANISRTDLKPANERLK
jgi:hypothetical protein